MCPYAKTNIYIYIYIIPSYLSVLKLQNSLHSVAVVRFSKKIKEKLFWVIEALNEASATNSIMNLNHTLFVIADAKALMLYSLQFCNNSNKILLGFSRPHPLSVTLSLQKPQPSVSRVFCWYVNRCRQRA